MRPSLFVRRHDRNRRAGPHVAPARLTGVVFPHGRTPKDHDRDLCGADHHRVDPRFARHTRWRWRRIPCKHNRASHRLDCHWCRELDQGCERPTEEGRGWQGAGYPKPEVKDERLCPVVVVLPFFIRYLSRITPRRCCTCKICVFHMISSLDYGKPALCTSCIKDVQYHYAGLYHSDTKVTCVKSMLRVLGAGGARRRPIRSKDDTGTETRHAEPISPAQGMRSGSV